MTFCHAFPSVLANFFSFTNCIYKKDLIASSTLWLLCAGDAICTCLPLPLLSLFSVYFHLSSVMQNRSEPFHGWYNRTFPFNQWTLEINNLSPAHPCATGATKCNDPNFGALCARPSPPLLLAPINSAHFSPFLQSQCIGASNTFSPLSRGTCRSGRPVVILVTPIAHLSYPRRNRWILL